MGLIFTRGDLKEVSEEVAKYKVRLIAFYIQIPGFFFSLITFVTFDERVIV